MKIHFEMIDEKKAPINNKRVRILGLAAVSIVLGQLGAWTWIQYRRYRECRTEVQMVQVQGNSMAGILTPGQSVRVEMNYYLCNEMRRGDVVLFRQSAFSLPLVKRALVLPGDQFDIFANGDVTSLIVNSEFLLTAQRRPLLLSKESARYLRDLRERWDGILPRDHYLVFGTENETSSDSRNFGPVSREQLLGRVIEP